MTVQNLHDLLDVMALTIRSFSRVQLYNQEMHAQYSTIVWGFSDLASDRFARRVHQANRLAPVVRHARSDWQEWAQN